MSALDKQEGGSHYKDYVIQPVVFIHNNNLGFLEGCVIKRMCRWQEKGGTGDLRKAIHEIELLIELTEMAEKREAMEREEAQRAKTGLSREAMERLSVKLGHPRIGDSLTTSAEQAVQDFVKAHPEALRGEIKATRQRQCTCQGSLHETPPMCDCPPDEAQTFVDSLPETLPMDPSYPELPLGKPLGAGPGFLDWITPNVVTTPPPADLLDGTIVWQWGQTAGRTRLGVMHRGQLVRDPKPR